MAKSIRRWNDSDFNRDYVLKVLCRTAYKLNESGRHTFSDELFDLWEAKWSDRAESYRFLAFIEQSSNIVHRLAGIQEWTFAHRSIQEVLCAKYLIERPDNIVNALSPTKIGDSAFNIFRFACEMTPDSSPLVSALVKQRNEEWVRAALLASILVQPVSLGANVEREATQFISSYLCDASRDIDVVADDKDGFKWRLVFQIKASRPKTIQSRISEFAGVITPLLGTGDPKRKKRLAEAFSAEHETKLTRAIQKCLQQTSFVVSHIDSESDTLKVEGQAIESAP
jgi:hypothetical protein